MPHLRRAVALAQSLPRRDGERLSAELLTSWQEALLVVDETGRLVHANPPGERLLRRGDGLRVRQGVLATSDARDEPRLQAGLRAACCLRAPRGTQLAIRRNDEAHGYAVMIVPAGRREPSLFPSAERALVVVRDLARPRPPAASALRAVFGFSRSQAAVAALLASGRDVKEIAQELGISSHTVRRHLSDIMERTETGRQAALVRLLLQVPAAPGG